MSKDAATVAFLENSVARLREIYPEFDGVMDRVRAGEITVDQAFLEMAEKMAQSPEKAEEFLEQSMVTYRERYHDIDPIDLDRVSTEELVIKPEKGLPRLHPMYEAALVERLQFDGDVPEARTGPLPEAATPAVPVDTDTRNPVMLGFLLALASDETKREIEERMEQEWERLEGMIVPMVESGSTDLVKTANRELAKSFIDADKDPDHYRRGQVPALFNLQGEKPNGSALANLDLPDKQQFTWKFVSTTQGRRSAIPIIQNDVVKELEKAGFGVHISKRDEEPLAEHQWLFSLDAAGSVQAKFSFVDVAGRAIAAGLIKKLGEKTTRSVWLDVVPVNQISERMVGWRATAYHRQEN